VEITCHCLLGFDSAIDPSRPMSILLSAPEWPHLHKQQSLNILSIRFVENRDRKPSPIM
jgi:hypothetical protein